VQSSDTKAAGKPRGAQSNFHKVELVLMMNVRPQGGIMTIELSQDRSDALVAANYEMLLALVELRRASGIRQEDVAAALGISQ
jgi:hypothetical protein